MQYEKVTPTVFNDLRLKLAADHATQVQTTTPVPTGIQKGFIVGHGVKADFTYNPEAFTLVVNVTSHPFYIPTMVIYHQIQEHLDAVTPTPANAAVAVNTPIEQPAKLG